MLEFEQIHPQVQPPDYPSSLFQTVKTSYAVLDLRFSILRPGMIAVAASTGVIDLFGFDIFDTGPITHVQTIQLADSSTLVLSLAWSPSELFSSTLAASLSNGRIVTLDYESPQSLKYLGTSHSLEAWTLAWSANAPEPLHLYSGGDDSTICEHSLQSKQNDLKISIDKSDSMFHDSKIHMAGVTAILSLNGGCGEDPEILLTGSYDEHIRVLTPGTSSSNRRFQVLAEKRLDGGVWRLNSLAMSFKENSLSFTILASCMHSGAKILKVQYRKGKEWTIEVLARFEEHESMNYASDAWLDPHASTLKFTVVSTSFYDRKLCVWKYEEP